MALIEINKSPSQRELRWFGIGLLAFAGLVGGLTYWRTGRTGVPAAILGAGAVVTAVYYAVPPLRRWVYLVWMYAAFPIGWVVSHVVLAAVYYLVVTPIGVTMRLLGRDPLDRRFDRSATTYWVPHDPAQSVERYFRQF
jgi:Saxitoxin biosynthesis operon protein SxtJ